MALQLITQTLIPPILGVDANAIFSNKVDQMFGVQLPAWTAQANALAQSLVDAASAANYSAWSTTSNNIGTGAKTFNIGLGKIFVPGQFIMITNATATANKMFCEVDSHAGGVLTVTSLRVWGSGAGIVAWHIGLSGPQGIGGDVWPAFAGNARKAVYVKADETGLEYLAPGWTLLGTINAAALNGQTSVSFTGIDCATYSRLLVVGKLTPSTSATINIEGNDGTNTENIGGNGSINAAADVGLLIEKAGSASPFCISSVHLAAAFNTHSTGRVADTLTQVSRINIKTSAGTFNNAGGLYLWGAR